MHIFSRTIQLPVAAILCAALRLIREARKAFNVAATDNSGGPQVIRQPPGTFSVRGHFLRVSPTFCWPLVVYILYSSVDYLTVWSTRRSERRLQASQGRMRKMLTDLKVLCATAACNIRHILNKTVVQAVA